MSLVSVLIPSRNEKFLSQTVTDVLSHATGEVEIGLTTNVQEIGNIVITEHEGGPVHVHDVCDGTGGP